MDRLTMRTTEGMATQNCYDCKLQRDKITQLVIFDCLFPDVEIVDELETTERGGNGFGSTGR